VSPPDFSPAEQAHVRAALRHAGERCGGRVNLARAMRVEARTLAAVRGGADVSPVVVVRLAKLLRVGVDDVLTGNATPICVCPTCGQRVPTVATA
jgi:hypothetical protein